MGTGIIPRDFGGVVRVEIDEAWYELRRYLGWYDRKRLSQLNVATMLILRGRVPVGEALVAITDAGRVPVAFGNMVDVDLQTMLAYLSAWSHRDDNGQSLPITETTVKRLSDNHAQRLLKEINTLEAAQYGPGDESPLPEPSSASSKESSSRGEPSSS